MKDGIVELLNTLSIKTGYSYTTLSSVNKRITWTFPNMSFDEKSKLLLSITELDEFIFREDNKRIRVNGYQLDMVTYAVLSDILTKKYNEKNKMIGEILDEYLIENKDSLMITPELKNNLKSTLGIGEETLTKCFYRLKKDHKDLNYKEIIDVIKFLLQFKGKFSFVPHKRLVKIKDNFYNTTQISFINTIINIKINDKIANPDEIINIYMEIYDHNKKIIDEPKINESIEETTKLRELEAQISKNLGYSPVFFKQLFNMLKCRNSSIKDYDYFSCLNMVLNLSSYVYYEESKRYKVVIEKYNYKYNASTFWIMLFELKLKNPSLSLDDAVLKVIEQTDGNIHFSDDGKQSKNKGASITKKGKI